MSSGVVDPWAWLVGRTASGLWRHVPYQAVDPGQGQDPSNEPRVEVIRRLIAYPPRAFEAVLRHVMALDRPEQPVRWLCYREPGQSPARPYWLCFVTARPGGRRFHVGLELFDRDKLGLWFLSGYDPAAVPDELRAPFPSRPELSLPRVELTDAGLEQVPLAGWLQDAWADRLRFSRSLATPQRQDRSNSADQSGVLDASVLALTPEDAANAQGLPPRAARARLLVELLPDNSSSGDPEKPVVAGLAKPTLFPLARLVTTIGRDPRGDVILEHRSVSMEHARIVWRDGVPGLEDLGSKNGTKLDGEPVPPKTVRPLPSEARVRLGTLEGLFVRDEEPPAVAPGAPPPPPRHALKLKALVAQGKLTQQDADQALRESESRGLTPGEVLLLQGKTSIETWSPPKGSCGLLLAAALTLLLAGCHSFGIPPLYEQDLDPGPVREGTRRVEWDWDVGVRPLFQARANEAEGRVEARLLFPLGHLEKTPTQTQVHLYPLYQRIARTDPDGFQDDDTLVFPLLAAGTHPVEGDYAYVFPFGGNLRGLLGKDEAIGVLFPLYGWTREKETETHHLLFPLIARTIGPGASGVRVLPFYGHQERRQPDGTLQFNRTTVLWPIFSWAEDQTNSKNRFESIVVFPFWGQTRSGWMDDDTILWPLFRWWHDKQSGYREWRVPFPFFIYGEGPGHLRMDFWPFLGLRRRGAYVRHFLLWPIGRREEHETESWTDERLWILPVFWTHHRVWKDRDGEDRQVNVWPLVRWESRADGLREVKLPAPLWFDDPMLDFEAILDPLWRLFRWRHEPDGREALDVLWGLWSTRSKPDGEERWDILGGLVGRTTGGAGGDKTRLFWFAEF